MAFMTLIWSNIGFMGRLISVLTFPSAVTQPDLPLESSGLGSSRGQTCHRFLPGERVGG